MLVYFCRATVLVVCSLVMFGLIWLLMVPGLKEFTVLLCIWAVAFSGLAAVGGLTLLAVALGGPELQRHKTVGGHQPTPKPPRSGSAAPRPNNE